MTADPNVEASFPPHQLTTGAILALERIAPDRFTGRAHTATPGRIFGGQAFGQALVAAGRTVPDDRRPHSAHGHFLVAGDESRPVDYVVDSVRDGGSFSTRTVHALQDGREIFRLTASFHRDEAGPRHQVPTMRSLPTPDPAATVEETLSPADLDAALPWLAHLKNSLAVEFRFADEFPRFAVKRGETPPPRQRLWIRTPEPLGGDPLVHAAAFGYMSDMFLMASALPPHGLTFDDGRVILASLDHTVWLHSAFRADEWHLYEQEGLWTGGGRGLARGHLFDSGGTLVATTMQEGLLRMRTER
ncbi:acyl-CoA thioesterase [Rhodococcus koreensis]